MPMMLLLEKLIIKNKLSEYSKFKSKTLGVAVIQSAEIKRWIILKYHI